ncbi:hypothetical protein IMG5_181340 [Ichthyophthirius multifiliis]|uniref:40S ribosomal protein S24 n=1 Tax=Ichthyophthirius multifiliis TaxID=5932 RepID=G0R2T3_ICHMU|nr:hypothetical protein IMG5_181340 [Ichthyophthirius multifiliis]EGR28205.1 hypothetical protein IMG5_181340 [Ichthyophthirius multifiliis]|eukprot:XP_004027550.1 hypothetical protein IMG5_181340 [Ichthyophthirius multifiliis]
MSVQIRTRKILVNPLFNRRQMVVDVLHPGEATVSRNKVKEILAKSLKVDDRNVVVYGFKTQFGGGKSTGFALVYENQQYLLKYESAARLRKLKILPAKISTRRSYKELKRKVKRTSGKAVTKLNNERKGETWASLQSKKAAHLKNFVAK